MSVTPITPTGEEGRAQALLGMGFTATQALLLAATQSEGEHVDLARIRAVLDAGCAHDLVMRIFL